MTESTDPSLGRDSGRTTRRRRITFPAWSILVPVLYGLLTAAMTWPLPRHLHRAIPGDGFDGWQNYWNLWWMKVALVDRIQNPFFTDLLYHPGGVGLYFHTLNPFNGLISLPVQLAGNLFLAYNTVVFLSWILGGYGAFLLTLRVLGRRSSRGHAGLTSPGRTRFPHLSAAFLSGLVFTFAPFHMAHLLGHMQVMSLEWIPFYILYLLRGTGRAREGRSWLGDGIKAGFFLTLVGLCDWYFVLYLLLFTLLYIVWQVVMVGRGSGSAGSRPRGLRPIAASVLPAATAGGLFLLLLSPVLVPMVREALQFDFMERPASDLYILSATAMDFLIPNRLHTLFRPESFTWIGNQIAPVSERTIAVGYLPLLLSAAGVWLSPRRSRPWLIMALVFFSVALGPAFQLTYLTWDDIPAAAPDFTWTPYGLLNRAIPFMRISRSVSRFAVMVQLCVAVTAGIGLAALANRWLVRRSTHHVPVMALVIFAFSAGVLAEFWVAPYPLSPPDTPDYYRELAARPEGGAVLNLPMNYDRPGYLLYQTVHRKPLSVAYISRDDPRTLTERAPVLQHFRHLGPDVIEIDPARIGRTVLHDLDVRWVVLDRYKMPGGQERAYTTALAESIFAGQSALYEDERLTVYEVAPPADPQPYLLLGPAGWGPLDGEDAGAGRAIGPAPASIMLRHVDRTPEIDLAYRTDPDTELLFVDPERPARALLALPPAPSGSQVQLALEEVLAEGGEPASGPPSAVVALRAEGTGTVRVESIGLPD